MKFGKLVYWWASRSANVIHIYIIVTVKGKNVKFAICVRSTIIVLRSISIRQKKSYCEKHSTALSFFTIIYLISDYFTSYTIRGLLRYHSFTYLFHNQVTVLKINLEFQTYQTHVNAPLTSLAFIGNGYLFPSR